MPHTLKPSLASAPSPLAANKHSIPSDHAARPGFRSPPNKGSKAQKAEPTKKK